MKKHQTKRLVKNCKSIEPKNNRQRLHLFFECGHNRIVFISQNTQHMPGLADASYGMCNECEKELNAENYNRS